jgi:HAD superfamily hydrolase (TIGR01509 family)
MAWSDGDRAELIRRKAHQLEALEHNQSVLFPGAREAIDRLAQEAPLAIASGARREEIVRVLDREGLAAFFRVIVASGDTAASKPAPDPYLLAVQRLSLVVGRSLTAAECVAIEDSRWGLESAHAAGLLTVGITHTYPADALNIATATVASLHALTWPFIRSLNRR